MNNEPGTSIKADTNLAADLEIHVLRKSKMVVVEQLVVFLNVMAILKKILSYHFIKFQLI
jgi:hypothetical protein